MNHCWLQDVNNLCRRVGATCEPGSDRARVTAGHVTLKLVGLNDHVLVSIGVMSAVGVRWIGLETIPATRVCERLMHLLPLESVSARDLEWLNAFSTSRV